MDKSLIKNMLQSNSQDELDEIISKRILQEKQEYRKAYFQRMCEELKSKGKLTDSYIKSFESSNYRCSDSIYPPKDENDLSVHHFEDFLDSDSVTISIATSWPIYSYAFDDEREIYELLAFELSKAKDPTTTENVLSSVSEAVFNYIGGAKVTGNDFTRLALLKPSSELDDDEKNKISSFKGTSNAWCVERSCMAHQLFKFLGIDSKIVMTTISNNGEHQIHAFNLIKIDGKTILFDASVMNPPKSGEKYNAVAFTLPPDVYDNNMQGVEALPSREIVGLSGRKYTIIYDLQNRKMLEDEKNIEK